ncbi:hypothetical protein [Streptomyces sp. NPDC056661]|uniref:hypothetical protein n=1 Tax=Streptomyces sp. NPDC056661 TaxID=3345898 RepID=UPI0036A22878
MSRQTCPTEVGTNVIAEIPVFLGERGSKVFACIHRPAGTARGLAVLCSSIGAEWKHNYRREVLLARRLAVNGMAAVRFHYLGTGNSDNGTTDFGQMVCDAQVVEQWAADAVGVPATTYFGARFGGFVAAAAGQSKPLVIWSPRPTGADYFREVFRIAQVNLLAAAGHEDLNVQGPLSELLAGRTAEVVGYNLSTELYRSAAQLTLLGELGAAPRSLRLVEFVGGANSEQAVVGYANLLEDHGFEASTVCFQGDGSWWLNKGRWTAEEERDLVQRSITDTADWLLAFLPGGSQ